MCSHSQLPLNCAWTSSGGGRRGERARGDRLTCDSSEGSWLLNGDRNTAAEVFLQGDVSRSEWPYVISRLWLVCPSESSFYPQYWSNIQPASYRHRPDGSNGCVPMSHPAIWGHSGNDERSREGHWAAKKVPRGRTHPGSAVPLKGLPALHPVMFSLRPTFQFSEAKAHKNTRVCGGFGSCLFPFCLFFIIRFGTKAEFLGLPDKGWSRAIGHGCGRTGVEVTFLSHMILRASIWRIKRI